MFLSCHAFSPADFVLADPARANGVSVSVCACRTFTGDRNVSFLSVWSGDAAYFSLKVCLESMDYTATGKTLGHTLTVAVCFSVILFLTAVRIVLNAFQGFAERTALYLRERRIRC